jgi:hypothetical protein
MAKFLKIVQVLVFLTVLATPILLFVVIGPVDAFENREQTSFPSAWGILAPNAEGRKQLADAILERSSAKRLAIATRNRWLRNSLGFVDENRVVSGAAGWLFYRPSLDIWGCARHEELSSGLDHLVTVVEIADAASAPITFAVAPNKASVMHEVLTGRASTRAKCYLEFERTFRNRISQIASPRLVDHYDVLRDSADMGQTYFRTDTHWNSLGWARAVVQLSNATRLAAGRSVSVSFAVEEVAFDTDLNAMILSDEPENDARHEVVIDGEHQTFPHLTIIHDSFYGRAMSALRIVFPEADYVRFRRLESLELEPESQLIVQSVERNLLNMFNSPKSLGWGSVVGDWLLGQSARAAEGCAWSSGIDLLAEDERRFQTSGHLVKDAGGLTTSTGSEIIEISVPADWEGGKICLRVTVDSPEASPLQVQLPIDPHSRAEASRYSSGASILVFPQDDRSSVSVVLPGRLAGENFRVIPSGVAGSIVRRLQIAPKWK